MYKSKQRAQIIRINFREGLLIIRNHESTAVSRFFFPSKCVFITQSAGLFVQTTALTRRVLKNKNQQKKSVS